MPRVRRIGTIAIGMLLSVLGPPAGAQICDGISTVAGEPLTTVLIATGMDRPLFLTAPAGDVDAYLPSS